MLHHSRLRVRRRWALRQLVHAATLGRLWLRVRLRLPQIWHQQEHVLASATTAASLAIAAAATATHCAATG